MAKIIVYLENGKGQAKTVAVEGRAKKYALAEAKVQAGLGFEVKGFSRQGGLRKKGNKPWRNKPRHRTGYPAQKFIRPSWWD